MNHRINSISSIILPKDELYKLYFIDKRTTLQCSKHFNVHGRTIINNFAYYGWKFRSRGEGQHCSDATKKKVSEANKGRRFSKEVNLSKGRPGRIGPNKGKTKENSESIRQIVFKLSARNKFNCLQLKLMSEKRSKENKLNCERVRKGAESRFVKPTNECKMFLLDFLNKCDETNVISLFYLAKQRNFRMKDIERNFEILKSEQKNLIESKIKNRQNEIKLENEIIIPFLNKYFQKAQLKRQVKIILPYNKRCFADIVLYENSKPYLIIESKVFIRKNNEHQLKQLKKYLKSLNCQYGLLTNGYRYRWYFYNKDLNELELIHDKNTLPLIIKNECETTCTTASRIA